MQRQPLGFYQDVLAHPPLKSSVFGKLYQLQGVVTELQKVLNLAPDQKKEWMADHHQAILEMFMSFQEHIRLDVQQEDMDKEMLGLLTEYSRALQECAAIIHTLFPEAKLES